MSLSDYAREHGLKRVGARPPLLEYLGLAWQRRDFAVTMSLFANQAANAKNRLGRWWVILLPTIQGAVYGLIFGLILGGNRPANFIPYLFTGVFLFSFFSGSFGSGATAVTSNLGLVRSLNFPRMLLPLSAVLRQFFNLLPQIGLLLVVLVLFQQDITWNWLLIVPILALMTLFATGLALVSARLTVHVQDLNKLIPFITRIIFYTSGIFFTMEQVLGGYPTLLKLMDLNPVYAFISLARGALIEGYSMNLNLWLVSSVWSFGLLLIGIVFFWKAEERYGRED
jgi:teichoic acid transport system permease protein